MGFLNGTEEELADGIGELLFRTGGDDEEGDEEGKGVEGFVIGEWVLFMGFAVFGGKRERKAQGAGKRESGKC